ncbi:MAG: hypothetical protein IK113_08065 [Bacteroidales bacterium]|nr:hypothetical protein [Bacteroidales bacterium]
MSKKVIYQTIADKGTPKDILTNGPYRCVRNPWLGNGYYFWDSFLPLAHWWGRQGYHGQYVITKIIFDYNPDDIFDLVGNTDHIQQFEEYEKLLQEDPCFHGDFTVGQILEHMKRHTSFPFKAIRAEGRRSINYFKEPDMKRQLLFRVDKDSYLDLLPPIQICFINKQDIINETYSIVYPENYRLDYSI